MKFAFFAMQLWYFVLFFNMIPILCTMLQHCASETLWMFELFDIELCLILSDRRKADKVILDENGEWEIKTITSALKNYFR